tara:strand:- start:114 stop:230 length:117 start_codon:yes stop_codon:yes gene_type:complete
MTAFVEYCVWFLAITSALELGWKGYQKYKEIKNKDKIK